VNGALYQMRPAVRPSYGLFVERSANPIKSDTLQSSNRTTTSFGNSHTFFKELEGEGLRLSTVQLAHYQAKNSVI